MNEQVKKIYDYVSKMEDKYEGELTCGANFETDSINMSAMSAYGSTRWFIEDLLEKENNYKVITLCGSTRFKDEFLEIQKKLTLDGNIVISVGLFGHSGDNEVWAEGIKEMLDDMHKRKIDMADEIFVINVGGYIGKSTKSEIEYAVAHNKIVRYLEEIK